MLNVDRVWARQAKRFPGVILGKDMQLQVITYAVTIAATGSAQNQAVNFGAQSLLIGIVAAAGPTGQAATQTYRPGMDLFSVAITYQANNRSMVGTTEALGSSVFGPYGDQYPAMEIYMPQNTSLLYNFTNLTSTEIRISVAHHCLVPLAS